MKKSRVNTVSAGGLNGHSSKSSSPVRRGKPEKGKPKKENNHLSLSDNKLNKSYLSKSHENLASTLRRRANASTHARTPRPVSWVGPNQPVSYIPVKNPAAPINGASCKRQVNFADIEPRKTQIVKSVPLRNAESPPAAVTSLTAAPLRKASSVQNLKSSSQSISRASSIDNLCRPTASSLQKNKQSSLAKNQETIREERPPRPSTSRLPVNISRKLGVQVSSMAASGSASPPCAMKKSSSIQNISKQSLSVLRRAQSSQNVSNGSRDPRSSMRNRASTPSTALAYNAELLAIFEKEKKALEARISELVQITENRKAEIEKHKIEIRNLCEKIPSQAAIEESEKIKIENMQLRSKLAELGVQMENGAPLAGHDTDDDLDISCNTSIKTPVHMFAGSRKSAGSSACLLDVIDGVSVDLCGTPDNPSDMPGIECSWERQSNKSGDGLSTASLTSNTSELSVACLQERIFRMEESQYSTNEELQATLQELGDLQRNVNQLAEENEQLGAERMVLLESLCTQTDKLENARTQIEHLKALILSDTEHTQTEREQELVNLLKIATEEREEFILKQCEIHNALESFDLEYKDMQERVISLNEKCKHLEDKRQGAINEKSELETQISDLVEELANERIELDRYKTLLENEKGKVLELQQLHKAEDKSELEQLVENTRADKEKVEQKCANLQESLAHTRRELSKAKEQIQSLESERCKAKERADTLEQELVSARNNNKTCLSDLEYKYDKVTADRGQLESEMSDLHKELESQRKENNRLLEENKNSKISVSDLQAELKGAKHRYIEFEKEMKALSQRHDEEASDWKQFQSDLQTAVVIANAIKAEAVEEKELLIEKNREMTRKMDDIQKQNNSLQTELERLKAQKGLTILPTGEIKKHLLGSDRELVALRQGRRVSDTRGNQNIVSVKSLIKTIEGQGSLGSSTGSSRRGSSDSLGSPTNTNSAFNNHIDATRASPERRTSNHNNNNDSVPLRSALKKPKDTEDKNAGGRTRTVMYEKTSSPVIESLRPVSSDNSVSSLLSIRNEQEHVEKSYDPLAKLVKQTGGSKRNALLKWCQHKSRDYREVDITNFSSSWNDGLAFCALLHNYIPDLIDYEELINMHDKRKNFTVAFKAAESVGISPELDVDEMVSIERPDWQTVMSYVTSIYEHFEAD
ncbi:cytospin-A-like [Watersipora subatra]|uniref:cytospin-A-like n=1 Tax=Watersipora subatra TaxID=2589382 RepID=UPI00355B0AFF